MGFVLDECGGDIDALCQTKKEDSVKNVFDCQGLVDRQKVLLTVHGRNHNFRVAKDIFKVATIQHPLADYLVDCREGSLGGITRRVRLLIVFKI